MKRILFDNQIFKKQPSGSISKYFTELITGIGKYPEFEVLPKKFYANNINIKNSRLGRLNKLQDANYFLGKEILEKVILKEEELSTRNRIKRGDFEIFHPTDYNPYFLDHFPPNKPLVLTVHDMIAESYYDHHYEHVMQDTVWKRLLIPRANHIITPSEYTKQQVMKYFPKVSESRISVVYHGTDNFSGEISTSLNLPEKFILYTGVRKHYKNFRWMIETLKDYLKENHITLLCAGARDFDNYERDMLARFNLGRQVKYFPVLSDAEFAALYSHALCLVFPSMEEGFGMPILEAFTYDCPVVVSNSSSFPEVAGQAALYFEPGHRQQLIKQVNTVIADKTTRDELVAKGKERTKLFTWEGMVAKHTAIYESLLN